MLCTIPFKRKGYVEEIELMKKFAFVLALSMVVAGSTFAADPYLYVPATGFLPLERDPSGVVCWSQGPNINGWKVSSETIGAFGLESELAGDFLPSMSGYIDGVRFWGGYYNWLQGDPMLTSIDLTFYNDGGCVPTDIICQYVVAHNANETFVGFDGFGWPTYEYVTDPGDVCCGVSADVLYWLGVQGGDHPFPPQWGRQQAVDSQLCDAVFKSAYFGYFDWTPVCDLGVTAPCDVSAELTCVTDPADCGGVATEENSWGAIKGLYR